MSKDRWLGVWVEPYDDSLKAQVGWWPDHDIDLIAEDIIGWLDLQEVDNVLDVGCGNGLVTNIVATKCREVHGVDFSQNLIQTAKREKSAHNIQYYLADALTIGELFPEGYFDKCFCYGLLQYLDYTKGKTLIETMSYVTKPGSLILIWDVPDIRRRWVYYHGLKRRIYFYASWLRRRLGGTGQDSLGWWWHPDRITKICRDLNLSCTILQQDERPVDSNYRFDALIRR